MEKTKNSVNKIKLFIIMGLLVAISVTLFALTYGNTLKLNSGSSYTKEYDSISKLKKDIDNSIVIPNIVDSNDNFSYIKKTMDMIEIVSDNYVVKIADFVDIKADTLALYDTCNEEEYTVKNNIISYLKIRRAYPNYTNCTIVNYIIGDKAYGILIGDKLSTNDILKMLNIDNNCLNKYINEESNVTIDKNDDTFDKNDYSNYKFYTVNINNNISLEMVETTSELQRIDFEYKSAFYIDNKIVLVFIYNDYDIDSNAFGGQSEIFCKNNTVIKYLTDNPFEVNSVAYNDYELITNTIEYIANSVTILK